MNDEDALRYHSTRPARENRGRLDQAGRLAARPVARLHAGRRRALPRDRRRSRQGRPVHRAPNLVAVVTNGTAVLGLGNIGPHAAKPVMEGKAVLFKRFADIDVFDLEIDETDPERFVEIVRALEPTFGGINLEDIRAPDCFVIERALRERMNDPGVPRRPARHRHHLRGGAAQRGRAARTSRSTTLKVTLHRRGRGRDELHADVGAARA